MTLPHDPGSERAVEAHRERSVAESFGGDAARYDRARPGYPDALVDAVIERAPGLRVLDVGTGTGLLARQLVARGADVLGVDPDARMAEVARAHGVPTEVATFESWEPDGRVFDAVVAGQAWHWVDPVAGAVKAGQVLRTGGVLALLAHVYEPPAAVEKAVVEALRQVVPDSPFVRAVGSTPPSDPVAAYRAGYEKFASGVRAANVFAEPEQHAVETEHPYTRAEWLDLLPTTGMLTRLPADTLAEVLAPVGAAIDDLGGSITVRFTTLALFAVRR